MSKRNPPTRRAVGAEVQEGLDVLVTAAADKTGRKVQAPAALDDGDDGDDSGPDSDEGKQGGANDASDDGDNDHENMRFDDEDDGEAAAAPGHPALTQYEAGTSIAPGTNAGPAAKKTPAGKGVYSFRKLGRPRASRDDSIPKPDGRGVSTITLSLETINPLQLATRLCKLFMDHGVDFPNSGLWNPLEREKKALEKIKADIKKTMNSLSIPIMRKVTEKQRLRISGVLRREIAKADTAAHFYKGSGIFEANLPRLRKEDLLLWWTESVFGCDATMVHFQPLVEEDMATQANNCVERMLREVENYVVTGSKTLLLHKFVGANCLEFLCVIDMNELLAMYTDHMPVTAAMCHYLNKPADRLRFFIQMMLTASDRLGQNNATRLHLDIPSRIDEVLQHLSSHRLDAKTAARNLERIGAGLVKEARAGWSFMEARTKGRLKKFIKKGGSLDKIMPESMKALRVAIDAIRAMSEDPTSVQAEKHYLSMLAQRHTLYRPHYAEFGVGSDSTRAQPPKRDKRRFRKGVRGEVAAAPEAAPGGEVGGAQKRKRGAR